MRSSANTAPNEEQDSLHVHPSITYSLILKGVIVNNFHFLHIKNNVENYVEMLKNYSFSQVDYIAGKKKRFGNLPFGLEPFFVYGLAACQSFYILAPKAPSLLHKLSWGKVACL